jgi:F-type H+-transporting ATPase subunit gamma
MSKMRRAQERMLAARPYAEAIRRTMGHLANAQPEYRHSYMVDRPVKRVAYLIISTDRGLAGGINVNTFRASIRSIREWKDKGVDADLAIVGNKGISFFKRIGGKVLATASGLGDKPTLESVFGTIKVVTDAFRNGEVDRVYVVYANFVNTMTQRATVQQLLPIEAAPAEGLLKNWDYIYEPNATDLLDTVLQRYVESQVYQAVIENTASEQSARMVAMKAATDNAGKIIQGLQLAYNKARQASITKELAEIVGGAAAV